MRKITILLTVLLVACVIIGCAKIEGKRPIKIGIDAFPGWGHMFIASEKGFFEKNGVDVKIVFSEDYLAVQKQFLDGDVDGAFMVYADAVYANGQGIDVKVVYISDYSVTADVIVARPEITGLKDLKGKVIGVEGINSFSHLFVLAVLEKNGLKEADFFIKNVAAQKVVDALVKGHIDAGHTYGPGKFKAKEKGYVYLAYSGDVPGIITDILAFDSKTVKNRPKEITAIIKSLFEARKFQETHREEALEIIAKAIKDTPESVGVGIDAVHYLDLEGNAKAMYKSVESTSLYGSGKIIADFYLDRGQLNSIPDFGKIIEPRFVDELRKNK